ncbi:uncharacterized protein G2W53_016670 [Senna tora]|uniref:Uncharacterized protein n=1 Tax=Senna tora TaxID=362788 RepID=A0A834TR81_9FABA|nr:uncharacterized protein G2W53_016670 [Senna tora]
MVGEEEAKAGIWRHRYGCRGGGGDGEGAV